jgi:hypothetical protein
LRVFDVFLTLICYKKHMSAPYRSYLLRLWLEPNDPPAWRAMLESPANGERRGFASIESLFAFLEQETERLGQETGLSQHQKTPGSTTAQTPD